jgi:heterodisulfide reductase subunit B
MMAKYKFALFLGCNAPVRTLNYDLATRLVLSKLDVEVVDQDEFACCGYPLESANHLTAITMGARNLAVAEREGMDILAICSACSGSLMRTRAMLMEDEELRKEVNERLSKIGLEFTGKSKVRHIMRFFHEDIGLEELKKYVTRPLDGWKVAVHYGCHYIKPSEIVAGPDNPELPHTVDELVEVTGAESIDYTERMLCCGGAILGYREEDSQMLIAKKMESIIDAGADCLEMHCAFCGVMYDGNQRAAERIADKKFKMPVLPYPQLLGLAMGFEPEELGFKQNRVKAKGLLAKLEEVGSES